MSDPQEAAQLLAKLGAVNLSLIDLPVQIEISNVLARLAVSLRDGTTRDALSSTSLPRHLSEVLNAILLSEDLSLVLLEQTGRAAANLAANCDAGRDGLVEAAYVDNCCRALERCCEAIDHAMTAVKALTVSLLNLVIEGHEASLKGVHRHSLSLIRLSNALLARLRLEDDADQILQWIWTILGIVLDDRPDTSLLSDVALPFAIHLRNEVSPPTPVLASAAEILDAWCNAETIECRPYLPHVAVISDFAEKAVMRDEHAEEDESKVFAGVKGSLITALVGLSSSVPAAELEFWSRMERWLPLDQRDDLQCCALLSYGNRAREDSSAIELLPAVLPAIRHILKPGVSEQVLHSVIGLLRNLSIPEANKVVLGEAGLLDKLVNVGVWSTERDLLGSVQGGGVGIVKNLCRGNMHNSLEVSKHEPVINLLLSLMKRTDDAAIRFEITRVFVNCIRSISSDATERTALSTFESEAIVSALLDMLKDSGPYPVLANESIIALALLSTFGSIETGAMIRQGLKGLMDRIKDVLAPEEGSEAASKEVRANLVTLLHQADAGASEAGLLAVVRATLKTARDAGSLVSEEGSSV